MAKWVGIAFGAALMNCSLEAQAALPSAEVEQAHQRYADDYQKDPVLMPGQFGVEVDKQVWTVEATAATATAPAQVRLRKGEPSVPTYVYTTDSATF